MNGSGDGCQYFHFSETLVVVSVLFCHVSYLLITILGQGSFSYVSQTVTVLLSHATVWNCILPMVDHTGTKFCQDDQNFLFLG